jgi:hypothetical protein
MVAGTVVRLKQYTSKFSKSDDLPCVYKLTMHYMFHIGVVCTMRLLQVVSEYNFFNCTHLSSFQVFGHLVPNLIRKQVTITC